MVDRQKNGLKGQLNLAQGKRRRSVALGCRTNKEIVREKAFFRRMSLFRTKRRKYQSPPENNELQFRPQKVFRLDHHITTDGFYYVLLTLGRCPGLNYADLSGRNNQYFANP